MLILNGLLANLEVREWSRLERMELLFSKDVTKLLRVVLMIIATRMEHHVVIALEDGTKFITIKETKVEERRSDVALAQIPICLEMDVKNVQLKTAA